MVPPAVRWVGTDDRFERRGIVRHLDQLCIPLLHKFGMRVDLEIVILALI